MIESLQSQIKGQKEVITHLRTQLKAAEERNRKLREMVNTKICRDCPKFYQ